MTLLGNTNPKRNPYLTGGDSLELQAFLAAGLTREEGDLSLWNAKGLGEELDQGLVRFAVYRRGLEPDF